MKTTYITQATRCVLDPLGHLQYAEEPVAMYRGGSLSAAKAAFLAAYKRYESTPLMEIALLVDDGHNEPEPYSAVGDDACPPTGNPYWCAMAIQDMPN